VNFAPIQNAADSLQRAAERYEKAYGGFVGGAATAQALARVNALLRQGDQALMIPEGLPKRPWYRHSLYAPGYYTGYGVKTMPGVREAIEQKDWKLVDDQVEKLAAALAREGELVSRAAKLLEEAVKPVP
jgi:N-acetylated-alpha-linked acidic dipeptidase